VWQERTLFDWSGTRIPVVPLEVQLATMILRDQGERLQATLSALDPASLDLAMLRRALADREAGGPILRIPETIRSLLAARPQGGHGKPSGEHYAADEVTS
jgi:hypothetical protein